MSVPCKCVEMKFAPVTIGVGDVPTIRIEYRCAQCDRPFTLTEAKTRLALERFAENGR